MTKPAILIYALNPAAAILKEITAGIEEEGVCYEVVYRDNENIEGLAYESANASVLGTGIGICNSLIALSLSSLSKGKYVFCIDEPFPQQARVLGTNAARAVKRKAFKEIGNGTLLER